MHSLSCKHNFRQDSRNRAFVEDRQRLNQALEDQRTQFAAAQEARAIQFAEERERLLQMSAEQQSQFTAAQDTRSSQFTDTQASGHQKFAEVIAQYNQRLVDQDVDFTRQKEIALRKQQEDLDGLKGEYAAAAKKILDSID